MEHLKVLVVVNGPSEEEVSLMRGGLELLASKANIPEFMNYVVFEDLVVFSESHQIRDSGNQYGYFLTVGLSAYKKVKESLTGSSAMVCKVGGIPTWSAPATKKQVIATLCQLIVAWKELQVEKKLVMMPATLHSKEEASEERAEYILANLPDFERYLQMMLSHNRHQACIFRLQKEGNPYIEVVDATKKMRVPISTVVPVLVPPEVISDESAKTKAIKALQQKGYEDPYLLKTQEFVVLLRIVCGLAKSGRARIEVALEAE